MLALTPAWDDPLETLPDSAQVGAVSRGILAIPHLAALIGRNAVDCSRGQEVDALIAWGDKKPAWRAAALARTRGVRLIRLEDAFFRSVGLAKAGAPPVGVVIDEQGIYFDASKPSRLETILNAHGWESEALLARAQDARRRVVAERLSKYNVGSDAPLSLKPGRKILLVDQVAGDRSIEGAGTDRTTFARMVKAAIDEHPAASLVVRWHPDVARGFARGFLDGRPWAAGVAVISDDVSVDALLDSVDEVWTVSSQLGFDALLRGKPVVTFGMPFYGGYGLTVDRASGAVAEQARARRNVKRSTDELFAAAAILMARYADPVTARPVSFEAALDRLVDWRMRDRANQGLRTYAYGFSRWKRATARAFYGGSGGSLEFRRRYVPPAAAPGTRVCVWGMRDPRNFEARCRSAGLDFARVEDGFLRSVGLGSDLIAAGSLVLDPLGIYYDAGRPSLIETLLAEHEFSAAERARAAALRHSIVAYGLSKYNLIGTIADIRGMAGARPVALVVGQVPSDASTRLGAGDVTTMGGLVESVRRARPDAFLVFKEHPDIVAGNRRDHGEGERIARHADLILYDGDIAALLQQCDEVHVLSSLTGFEALLRELPVVCWGRPFYAGWGLTADMSPLPRRTRRLALDELVAGALVAYPRYVSPFCGVPCGPEDFIAALVAARQRGPTLKRSILQRLFSPPW